MATTEIMQNSKDSNESIEEIRVLLGLNTPKEIEQIKNVLEETNNNFIKTLQTLIASSKSKKPSHNPVFEIRKEENRQQYYPTTDSHIAFLEEYNDIEISLKEKPQSDFICFATINNNYFNPKQTLHFSTEFMEKVKEAFAIKEKENSEPTKGKKKQLPQTKGHFLRKAMERKKELNNKNNNNNGKYGNNNENYYDNAYYNEYNNNNDYQNYGSTPHYNKKNPNNNAKNKVGYNNSKPNYNNTNYHSNNYESSGGYKNTNYNKTDQRHK